MDLYPATWGHGSLAFNEHLDASGNIVLAKVQDSIVIDEAERESTFRDLRSALHLGQGGTVGRVHKGFGLLRLSGRIEVPDATQLAKLSDRERQLRAAFDPYICLLDSPSTEGVYPFDFSEPTTDTATYPSGRIALRYYARPASGPSTRKSKATRSSIPWAQALVLPDPRLYEQAETTLVLSPGTASGDLTNRGTTPGPLKATIVTSANGASNFTITRAGVSFILNLSAVGASTIVVVMETCGPYGVGRKITDDGAAAFGLMTSGPATWLDVPVGTTSFSISNHTNITSCTLGTFHARA